MSQPTATRARPVSPHLTIYRWRPTMAMSIAHRITGIALYFGMLLVAAWLVAAASGPVWFDNANWLAGSWFGILVLIGFTWALFHHLFGGIRHYIWDTGVGMGKETSTLLAWLTLAASLLCTAVTWAVYFIWF
ncbi:MAG: succinate dehydrogenase, cytochrome b556 subunit [Rhizobiales bacterium]|nr:succinate dehydrogenase, cytochrome b556 subunit [Hyphomicrobiales bacterium]OJU32600.1 MAG: succinate dehydrogenase, cytochrome b556 subunit [Rhizobiales bacterium 68-8]